MARPVRIEYDGALYLIIAQSADQQSIFLDDEDKGFFLLKLEEEVLQQRWICNAYCLMDNYYLLCIETPEANLVKGMRRLQMVYSQYFNKKHHFKGNVFGRRYKSIVIQKDLFLLNVCKYIVRSPVRDLCVDHPGSWLWSSYRAMIKISEKKDWLDYQWVMDFFAGKRREYDAFIMAQTDDVNVLKQIKNQLFLGDSEFISHIKNSNKNI